MRTSVKRKRGPGSRKAKRRKVAKSKRRVAKNAKRRPRSKKGKIDTAQSVMLQNLQKQISKFKPELQITRHTNSGDLAPAAAVSWPDSQFFVPTVAGQLLKPAGDDHRDTAGDRGWVEGQQIQPISTFHRFTVVNTGTAMESVRFYFVLVDCKKMGGSDIQTAANLVAAGNPKYHFQTSDWAKGTDVFDIQGILLRRYMADEEKTTEGSVNNNRRKWSKLLAVREFHLPGNNNGHRHHVVNFTHGYRHTQKWTLYTDQLDGATNMAPSAGKMVMVYVTSRNGAARVHYTMQFKYLDV